LLQWRKPIEAMEKGNGKSSVPINFHLWDWMKQERSLIMFTVRFRKWEMVLRVLLLRIR
jgi:FKBP-type peptidyl-prolyl cis-trans isomerases 1